MITSVNSSVLAKPRTLENAALRPAAEREISQSCILIVDDESLNIEVARRHLEFAGYTNLISTDHAGQALPLIGLHRPDVVLLDIHMPEINGLEILAALRSDKELCRTPVIILTGSSDPETKLIALQAGAADQIGRASCRERV